MKAHYSPSLEQVLWLAKQHGFLESVLTKQQTISDVYFKWEKLAKYTLFTELYTFLDFNKQRYEELTEIINRDSIPILENLNDEVFTDKEFKVVSEIRRLRHFVDRLPPDEDEYLYDEARSLVQVKHYMSRQEPNSGYNHSFLLREVESLNPFPISIGLPAGLKMNDEELESDELTLVVSSLGLEPYHINNFLGSIVSVRLINKTKHKFEKPPWVQENN
ncbi:hypothetical protein OsccyDRAFT_0610 [Leptolyngbyaceae cyanobacterium JSC-12]|nr:hypothetical protein OsccyDRAFT_0610 [Leptolyngbyaceae cyanobacterium JSC-12]